MKTIVNSVTYNGDNTPGGRFDTRSESIGSHGLEFLRAAR